MKHFRGHKGYSFLVILLTIGLCLGAGIFIGIISALGMPGAQSIAPILFGLMLFAGSFIAAGRFVKIENRRPKLDDTNTIAMLTAAYLIVPTLLISVLYLISTIIPALISGDAIFEALSTEALLGMVTGILGLSLVCYIMIFLNFLLVAKLRGQRA